MSKQDMLPARLISVLNQLGQEYGIQYSISETTSGKVLNVRRDRSSPWKLAFLVRDATYLEEYQLIGQVSTVLELHEDEKVKKLKEISKIMDYEDKGARAGTEMGEIFIGLVRTDVPQMTLFKLGMKFAKWEGYTNEAMSAFAMAFVQVFIEYEQANKLKEIVASRDRE